MAAKKMLELAEVFRSKNAGPFLITIDIVLRDQNTFLDIRKLGILTQENIALRFGIKPSEVQIFYFEKVNTIKITFPRKGPSSGAPGDRDVYGAQQHGPLLDLEISK